MQYVFSALLCFYVPMMIFALTEIVDYYKDTPFNIAEKYHGIKTTSPTITTNARRT